MNRENNYFLFGNLTEYGQNINKKTEKENYKKRLKLIYFFFFAVLSSVGAASVAFIGSSALGSSFLSSISVVISSIGFGGGVVAIVQPIHAPMKRIATNATNTGTAMSQNRTSAVEPMLSHG